eukprot:TRINITY_DN28583_c0_g1_i1.p1 TRINITY_DN28583_c0_g1~~TRINITY_DN28583_c0_g1_i1.p1  ORF type:complete len:198 (-),score=22.42 TRINITY_DN28583_c0_g1_i1:132-725(-)
MALVSARLGPLLRRRCGLHRAPAAIEVVPLPCHVAERCGGIASSGSASSAANDFQRRSIATSPARLRSMSIWGTGGRTSVPLLPQGMDPRERHHCGPHKYIGMTPKQIVSRFKNSAIFPWYRVAKPLHDRRFEELYQMARISKNKRAVEAVQLLTNEMYDKGQPLPQPSRTPPTGMHPPTGDSSTSGAAMEQISSGS